MGTPTLLYINYNGNGNGLSNADLCSFYPGYDRYETEFNAAGHLQIFGYKGEKDMSDLKHKSLVELRRRKARTESYIAQIQDQVRHLTGKINNQQERLKWINIYIEKREAEQVPVQMTVAEVEERLGHKVEITS